METIGIGRWRDSTRKIMSDAKFLRHLIQGGLVLTIEFVQRFVQSAELERAQRVRIDLELR